jgi:hypothetical protein
MTLSRSLLRKGPMARNDSELRRTPTVRDTLATPVSVIRWRFFLPKRVCGEETEMLLHKY